VVSTVEEKSRKNWLQQQGIGASLLDVMRFFGFLLLYL